MTSEQLESQPGFWNDCRAWANWMAQRESDPDIVAVMEGLGLEALLTAYAVFAKHVL